MPALFLAVSLSGCGRGGSVSRALGYFSECHVSGEAPRMADRLIFADFPRGEIGECTPRTHTLKKFGGFKIGNVHLWYLLPAPCDQPSYPRPVSQCIDVFLFFFFLPDF